MNLLSSLVEDPTSQLLTILFTTSLFAYAIFQLLIHVRREYRGDKEHRHRRAELSPKAAVATLLPCLNNDRRDIKVSYLHVLIPCHVSSDRRVATFLRCAKSIMNQLNAPDFVVFVGLSGPKCYRNIVRKALAHVSKNSRPTITWYLQDAQVEVRPQMEHLRHLLECSRRINPRALLAFVDNDDMCHPTRFATMYNLYQCARIPTNGVLSVPCKLLLDYNMTPEEGEYEKYVDPQNPYSFNHWKKFPKLQRKVELARNSRAYDMDAEEYFDYLVPSAVLHKFFDMTPVAVASHRFCDLRLYQMLRYHDNVQTADVRDMWLLAHYKVTRDEKYRSFDNHGRGMGDQGGDQISFSTDVASAQADQRLAQRFSRLSPGQMGMCRAHLESIIIQYMGWNESELQEGKRQKVAELNDLHEMGLGDALWDECHAHIRSLFDDKIPALPESAWKDLIQW
eukprot:scaffold6764_cov169-Amphora_coffeaeformis.AAC.6